MNTCHGLKTREVRVQLTWLQDIVFFLLDSEHLSFVRQSRKQRNNSGFFWHLLHFSVHGLGDKRTAELLYLLSQETQRIDRREQRIHMKRSQKHWSVFFFSFFFLRWTTTGRIKVCFLFFVPSKIEEYHIETKRNVVIKISPAPEKSVLFAAPALTESLETKKPPPIHKWGKIHFLSLLWGWKIFQSVFLVLSVVCWKNVLTWVGWFRH